MQEKIENYEFWINNNFLPKKSRYEKIIYYEKATKIWRNLKILFKITYVRQKSLEFSSSFCALLRIYELYRHEKKIVPCSDIIELQNYLFPNKVSANDQTVLNCCNFVNCAKCDVCSFAEFSLVFAWRASIKGRTVIQNPVRKFRYR